MKTPLENSNLESFVDKEYSCHGRILVSCSHVFSLSLPQIQGLIQFYMYKNSLALLIISTACTGTMEKKAENKKPMKSNTTHKHNKLIHESSPYLLQHAHNPVNWYAWGAEALEKALLEDKLILVSVGYSACHWCHVMERESFENEAIAAIMNEHFICIKVDREERPDIDQIYMNAVQLISGRGGWPLNCFALPDGRPFYGGTYFRPKQFEQVLLSLVKSYVNDREEVVGYADKLTQGVLTSEVFFEKTEVDIFNRSDLKAAIDKGEKRFDYKHGGQQGSPKFPMPGFYDFLLEWSFLTEDKEIESYVMLSLDKMANGGIYDHLGGGFARYSTDEEWLAPHFEKMLYDNAQLVSLYSHAYQLNKNTLYERTIKETLDYIEREMTAPTGGFYAAFDADSEGEEGKFYVWQKEEVESVLGKSAQAFMDYYDVSSEGNWEYTNILNVSDEYSYTDEIAKAKQKLFKHRSKRIMPALDDKILTSWNALMIKAYVDAYRALGDETYLKIASENANLLIDRQLKSDGKLLRSFKNGTASIDGFLDDYALFIEALLELYGVTFDIGWLETANTLLVYCDAHFYDEASGMYYYTSDEAEDLIARKMELNDNVIPASASVMAHNLFQLAKINDNPEYDTKARQMLANINKAENSDAYFSFNWLRLHTKLTFPYYELVFTGSQADDLRANFEKSYHPNALVCGTKEESQMPLLKHRYHPEKSLIYVCVDNSCQLPVETVSEAVQLME